MVFAYDSIENRNDVLALLLFYPVEYFFQMLYALASFYWNLIVRVPELNFLQHGKGNWVNENQRAVDTGCIDNQDLLVRVLKTQESWFCIVEGLFVVVRDEIFATFICANRDSFLGERGILLNVPNF